MSSGSVPDLAAPTLGFVDAGRLGSSLAEALVRTGHRVDAVSRRDPARARALAERLGPAVTGTDLPQEVVDRVDIVFLTSTDDRIASRAESLAFRAGQAVIHCSGATPVGVLDPARESGASVGGFHPLQTFPDEHGAQRLRGVTFGVESPDPALLAWLEQLATALGGHSVRLDVTSRPLYHASAVMVGPLTSALAGLAGELWQALGQDRAEAVRALAPLLEATAHHAAELGIPEAVTGPYARGDLGPVQAHLDALAGFRPAILRAYAALAAAQLPIAAERGNIPEDRMRALRGMLENALRTPGP